MSRYDIIDCAQRTPEWYAARAGRATASRAAAVLAKIKSGEAATRRDYKLQLATERLTGTPQENGFISAEMQRGIDLEPAARDAYEIQTGEIVQSVGFLSMVEHLAGCSPDGRIDGGLVSFKCPKSTTHVEYLKCNRVPPEYVPQVTHELWVAEDAEHYDFVSYDDRLPAGLQLLVVRAYRSEFKNELAAYEVELLKFLGEVEQEVEALKKLRKAA
jgi:hypothetical protein